MFLALHNTTVVKWTFWELLLKKKLKTTAAQTKKKEVEETPEEPDVGDCYDPLSIFVTNLKWDINESHLATHFGSVGDIAKGTLHLISFRQKSGLVQWG